MIRLVEKNGDLYLPTNDPWYEDDNGLAILLYIYPAGDCDRIEWPNPNMDHLRSALFDVIEMGLVEGDCRDFELPDGSTITV